MTITYKGLLRVAAEGFRQWFEEHQEVKLVSRDRSTDYSAAIVEGYVNKLKTVKRVMYGRASIELLRKKMVFSKLGFN